MENKNFGIPKHPLFHPFSRRLHLLLLLHIGFCLISYMRGNLGVTMTCMVNSTAVALKTLMDEVAFNESSVPYNVPEQCRQDDSVTGGINDYGGTLEWDGKHQKEIFKGTFWSSLVTALLSGYITDRTSAKWLLQIGCLFYIVCTVIFPWLALHVGYVAALTSRIVMGIGEGFVIPTINALLASWYPDVERSTAAAIYTAGNQIGGFFGSPLAAYLCASRWQWPSVFYVCGAAGVVWSIIWCLTVSDSPSECKYISQKERQYLEAYLHKRSQNKQTLKIPWKAIFTSAPVWAIFIAQCLTHFIFILVQTYTPTYFKEVLFMKLTDNGIYAALPNLTLCVSKILWSMLMDKMKEKRLITPTTGCKISQWFSNVGMAINFICLAFFVDCTKPWLGVTLMCLIGVAFSTTVSGFFTSLLSIAPSYVGTISSISFLFGVLGQLAAPDLVGFVNRRGTVGEWRIIFVVTAIVSLTCGIIFGVFGSAEIQPWALQKTEAVEEDEKLLNRDEKLMSSINKAVH